MKNILLTISILFLQKIHVYSQANADSIQTIDNLLELKWTKGVDTWSPYDGHPLSYQNLLFPYQNVNYALDAKTGRKIFYASSEMRTAIDNGLDSLLFFENYHKNKQETEHRAINVRSGKVLIDVPTDRLIYLGYNTPSIVENGVVYFPKKRNVLVAVDISTSESIWEYTAHLPIYTKPKVRGEVVYFSDQQFLYALDKNTGKEQWNIELGEIASSIEFKGDYAYLWVKPSGLVALNLNTNHIEWTFDKVNIQKNNYNLLIQGDTIYFSSTSIFAVDREDGSLIWQSEHEDSYSSVHIALCNDYILYYDAETDGEVPPLTAINKRTGKIKYQYFTSERYPQDFENERELNSLDYATMRFVKGTYEDMIFGVYHDKIYAFEILKE